MKLAITLALGLAASVSLAEETKPQETTTANTEMGTEATPAKAEKGTTETAPAATTETTAATGLPTLKTECKGGNVTRHVWVSYQNETGEDCKVHYSKPDENAEERVLWSAKQDPSFCQQKAKEFIEKQKGWNFECSQSTN